MVIIDIEMPESCTQCEVVHYNYNWDLFTCPFVGDSCPSSGRRSDCPLQETNEQLAPYDIKTVDAQDYERRGFKDPIDCTWK